jgi:hypothetical protein
VGLKNRQSKARATSAASIAALVTLALISCDPDTPRRSLIYSEPTRIEIHGYTGHAMEPFLSPDGEILLFNNLNAAPENTNLHWARRIDEHTFEYQGELSGVNTMYLEGVASLDGSNRLYFVSLRDYDRTLASVYTGNLSDGVVTNLSQVAGVSKNMAGWLNFDVDVDRSGNYLYLADGRFDANGGPHEADIFIAHKTTTGFERLAHDYLVKVNTVDLEYAACISPDQLELYFTRLLAPITSNSQPEIWGTTRTSTTEDFKTPVRIEAAEGFVEAPTLSADGNALYYHKAENGTFVIYSIRRTGL